MFCQFVFPDDINFLQHALYLLIAYKTGRVFRSFDRSILLLVFDHQKMNFSWILELIQSNPVGIFLDLCLLLLLSKAFSFVLKKLTFVISCLVALVVSTCLKYKTRMINAVRLIHIRDPRFYQAMPKWTLSSLLDLIFYSFIISMILVQILQLVVEGEIAQFYQHIGISLADPSSPFSTQLEFTSMLYLIWINNQSKKRTD